MHLAADYVSLLDTQLRLSAELHRNVMYLQRLKEQTAGLLRHTTEVLRAVQERTNQISDKHGRGPHNSYRPEHLHPVLTHPLVDDPLATSDGLHIVSSAPGEPCVIRSISHRPHSTSRSTLGIVGELQLNGLRSSI